MARTAQQRLPRQLRNPAAARPARPARPALKVVPTPVPAPAEQPVSRGALRAALAAMAFGIAIAAAIFGLALFQLRNAPTVVAAVPTHDHSQAAAAADETAGAAAAPKIAISTRYNAQLELEITARVSIQGNALFKADVAAYTSMVEMPQGHDQGPIAMRELRPGVYRTVTRLPMVGDYAVRVEVNGPARGTGVKTIAVGPHGHSAAHSPARHTP
jgi:hypothetical protein